MCNSSFSPEWDDLFFGCPNPHDERVKEFGSWLRKDPNAFVTLYHGTSEAAQDSILRHGLLPTSALRRRSLGTSSGYVYLTPIPSVAYTFGQLGDPTHKTVIFKVLLTIRRLRADKDQLANKRNTGVAVRNTLTHSLVFGRSAAVRGKIDRMVVTFDEEMTHRFNTKAG